MCILHSLCTMAPSPSFFSASFAQEETKVNGNSSYNLESVMSNATQLSSLDEEKETGILHNRIQLWHLLLF